MPRSRLLVTLAGAGALLALAPSVASSHRRLGDAGHCHVNIASIAPRLITAGESTEISGLLTCHSTSAAGQTVELFARAAGSGGFSPVQSTTTEMTGAYKFSTAPEQENTWFYVRSDGAQSDVKRLFVAAAVTLTGPAEGTLDTHVPETFSGTVTPADAGARVILQRQNAVNGEEWHWIGSADAAANGSFTIVHSFRVPGDASIRVLVRSDGLNVPSPSNTLEYQISQAENPQLTINASADSIVYGQSVTISGTLAGVTTAQTVTLYGHTVHQHGWAAIAQMQTETNGNYSFPAQMPVNNTFYDVRSATQKSALLYEDVRAVLTAEASPTTVEAGQPVTFSGKVAPEASGHAIYLEVQNAAGTGFHVVQVGHVIPGSTYSIVHQFYVPGMKVVRIELPGGPANGRAISQTFTITDAAPASALAPEAGPNSSLPSEGQTQGDSEVETSGSLEELEGQGAEGKNHGNSHGNSEGGKSRHGKGHDK